MESGVVGMAWRGVQLASHRSHGMAWAYLSHGMAWHGEQFAWHGMAWAKFFAWHGMGKFFAWRGQILAWHGMGNYSHGMV